MNNLRKGITDMIAYGCLGILFLFIVINIALYFHRQKNAPTSDDLDDTLLTISNPRGDHAHE